MTCTEFEIVLCDYIDNTLAAPARVQVEDHMAACSRCAEFARDAGAAAAFLERVGAVEPPQELVTQILFQVPRRRFFRFGKLLEPLLQPRFAMGMAMTIFSLGIMAQCAGIHPRQLSASDLNPVKVWAALEDRAHRAWQRTLKSYESIRFVYEIQARLREWSEQQQAEENRSDEQRPAEQGAAKGRGSEPRRPESGGVK